MPLKVTWKKGMRLTADIFDAMDWSYGESIRLSNLAASGARMGLIPAGRPFELTVNVTNNVLTIVSLSCHGVTRSGRIVDIDFNSDYTNTFNTSVGMPGGHADEGLLLVIRLHDRQWREVSEMYSEQAYSIELLNTDSPVDSDSLPIGRIINQYGWRLDEEFVPPCLFTDAHPKYVQLVSRAMPVLRSISDQCFGAPECAAKRFLGVLWPEVTRALIDIDKSQGGLTPAGLFAALQKVVSAFVIGCSIDEYIKLSNTDPFVTYLHKPYDGKHLYRDIQEGVDLCSEISVKMGAISQISEVKEEPQPNPKPAPRAAPKPVEPEPVPNGRKPWEGIEI